jgi:sulfur carrier protein ThiS
VVGVGVELVDQRLFGVDELVYDLQERCDCGGARLVDLLKDLAVPEAFLVAIDDLVVPDANASVTILKEPVGVVTKSLAGLHGYPPEVEGVSKLIVGRLEVQSEGLGQVGP